MKLWQITLGLSTFWTITASVLVRSEEWVAKVSFATMFLTNILYTLLVWGILSLVAVLIKKIIGLFFNT